MKKGFVIGFWAAVVCIVLAFFLLILFRLLEFSSITAAYLVAILSFIGGALLIVSSTFLVIQNKISATWMRKLEFHLPEFIALGLAFIIIAIVLFVGKVLK